MTNMKEMASNYEVQETKLISDLDRVSVDLEVVTKKFKEGQPDEFSVDVVTIAGQDYRVPKSVLAQLKIHLEKMPDLKHIQVIKTGSGLNNTKYSVVPLRD